ncbi:putative solute carrier family 25 member 38 isoform X2 [Apostichopus japonicus]|uniref:Putative solute carrier family 25 member 38 isoform X2 n=1 Tax=Stichopus japonicus TaxID=307972 RepID=A0A2G8LJR4_STIJA|nr:putative solute carrier family 25 member 38 isoform X2 [Apostichopus japonicus]
MEGKGGNPVQLLGKAKSIDELQIDPNEGKSTRELEVNQSIEESSGEEDSDDDYQPDLPAGKVQKNDVNQISSAESEGCIKRGQKRKMLEGYEEKRKTPTRKKWTELERTAVLKHLHSFIEKRKLPDISLLEVASSKLQYLAYHVTREYHLTSIDTVQKVAGEGGESDRVRKWQVEKVAGKGLFSGFSATLLRDAPFSGIYFMFYSQSKKYIPQETFSPAVMPTINFCRGLAAGLLAAVITQPFDTTKTHMQLNPKKHNSFPQLCNILSRMEALEVSILACYLDA